MKKKTFLYFLGSGRVKRGNQKIMLLLSFVRRKKIFFLFFFEGVGSPEIISSSSLKDVPVISYKDFFLLFSERFYSSSCQKKYSSSPYENFSSFCQKKRIKYSSSSSLRGVIIFNYIFLFLSMNRKIFSSFYFSIMKVKELF